DLPEVKTELPGGKTDSSILRTDLPESRTDPPGALKTELPGGKTDPLPENGVPEMAARPGNLPGSAVPFRMPGGNDSGRMPGMPGGAAGIPQGAVKPGGFLPGGGLPGRRDGEHPSSPFGRRETPQQRILPGFQNSAQPGARDHQSLSAGAGFLLEYFGDRIPIPDEGAWIGREGLGKQWFDGNLMISRKHVFVKPNPKSGRLQVNEDKSLNGVFYQGPDGGRVRMEGARMLSSGEVLWIYNIPLRIVIR
ncbi:MAG: hypothetical protein Q4D81_03685, partial [Eubacteriales bacterium]|nr:hypothetical protein [Eubacteriales bacterium]